MRAWAPGNTYRTNDDLTFGKEVKATYKQEVKVHDQSTTTCMYTFRMHSGCPL